MHFGSIWDYALVRSSSHHVFMASSMSKSRQERIKDYLEHEYMPTRPYGAVHQRNCQRSDTYFYKEYIKNNVNFISTPWCSNSAQFGVSIALHVPGDGGVNSRLAKQASTERLAPSSDYPNSITTLSVNCRQRTQHQFVKNTRPCPSAPFAYWKKLRTADMVCYSELCDN